ARAASLSVNIYPRVFGRIVIQRLDVIRPPLLAPARIVIGQRERLLGLLQVLEILCIRLQPARLAKVCPTGPRIRYEPILEVMLGVPRVGVADPARPRRR